MKVYDLESHKYADIFPMIENNELENLKSDIKEHGLLQPIIMLDNKILDGRNRYTACKQLGITPKFEEYKGDKPLEFVISLNLKRRHLTQSQAGVIALDVLPMLEELARQRQGSREDIVEKLPQSDKARSAVQAGKLFNVSEKYVREAKKLKETSPELLEEVRLGHKNFSEINKELKIKQAEEKKEKLKEDTKNINSKDIGLIEGDCLEKIPTIENESISCLIIDPPYGIDFQSNYKLAKHKKIENDQEEAFELLDKSLNLVKPKMKKDSHLYIFTSWKVIDKVKPIIEKYFNIKNILIWNKNNWSMGDLDGNYAEKYEMIIFATQGDRKLLGDNRPVNVLDYERTSNLLHPTQKPLPLLKELIKNSTVEGEIILDYFAGSGTTLKAAKDINRNYIGIEKELDYINIIKSLLI